MGSLAPYHSDHFSRIFQGDNQVIVPQFRENMFDSIVTDPPYELGVFGEKWDNTGIAYDPETWRTFMRVLKPGGYMVAFGGSRTFHRILCAIEDAGFEVRDVLLWLYGNGFPKGQNISVAIDKSLGHRHPVLGEHKGIMDERWIDATPLTDEAREWEGWNTTLKPSYEPIALVRKPLPKGATVVSNVRTYGTGALNIGANREKRDEVLHVNQGAPGAKNRDTPYGLRSRGRDVPFDSYYPSNCICDEEAAELLAGKPRFYYTAKASQSERKAGLKYNGTKASHTTVKPVDLMRWLVRLVTRPGGRVLDPFTGSGTTRLACHAEGMEFVGVELSEEYCRIASERG